MDSTIKKGIKISRSEAQNSISKTELKIMDLDSRIEKELRKNPEGRELLLDMQKTRVLLNSAQQYLTQGENAYNLGRLNILLTAAFGAGSLVELASSQPTEAAVYGTIGVTTYLIRHICLKRAEGKYQRAREILERKHLSDVALNPATLDDYVVELNKIKPQGFKIKAEPLDYDQNHIWISAGDEVHGYRIGSVYRDQALLTNLHLVTEVPKVDTLEKSLAKLFKLFFGEEESKFFCPAWGIAFDRDPRYYLAATEIREMALKYAVR